METKREENFMVGDNMDRMEVEEEEEVRCRSRFKR